MKTSKPIGVLALQGDFAEHISLLRSHEIEALEVRSKNDLDKCCALIIPGGESTAISHLMSTTGLDVEIKKRVKGGMGFYGTCAGAIVAAKKIIGEERFLPLGLIDVELERNAFGRQIDSFEAQIDVKGVGQIKGIFIRAPKIVKVGKNVEVLAELDGKPVLVRSWNVILGSFHPEIENNFFAHKMLLEMP
ncbi:MAG TPA: pyridoxal 5'-phosphate synthase glutaminase subunit PdxT [archaeon]|nr:pyridoxal 5'-phosphate synthase glutaminase subunit PdxT [archaeon]